MNKMPLFHRLISTTFGVGYFPYGPGTMGALAGIVIWAGLAYATDYTTLQYATLSLIVVFTALGIWSGTVAERYWGEDPSRVVMDETVGQWIALLAVPAHLPIGYVVGAFVLFRFFDIVKPLGVRRMESLGGGLGIMADDILAGIYAAGVLVLVNLLQV